MYTEITRRAQDPLGLISLKLALQFHLFASCGVEILEVSAVALNKCKAQALQRHVF